MNRILTLGFEFQDTFYYSLVRVNEVVGETEYKITVMNGALETMLFGNNIIKEKNGYLNVGVHGGKHDELKLIIAEALGNLLNKPLQMETKFDNSITNQG